MYNVRVRNTTMSISIRKVNIHMVQCNDIPRVIDFLLENYFPVEPLFKYVNLSESPEAVECLKKFCTNILQQNVSVVATSSEGELVGVFCNMVITKDQSLDMGTHPDIKKISDFVRYVEDESEIYELYPGLEEYMQIAFMCLREDYRCQGVTKRLVDHTREIALKLGLKVMRLDCCRSEMAAIAQKKGWTCLKEVKYDEYKVDDEQVFHPDEPNATYGIYTIKTEHPRFLKLSQ